LRKVLFTLDGILHDIAGRDFRMEFVLARHLALNWLNRWSSFGSPLALSDWMLLPLSTLLYPSRIWMQWAQTLTDRSPSRVGEAVVRAKIATSGKHLSPRHAGKTSHRVL